MKKEWTTFVLIVLLDVFTKTWANSYLPLAEAWQTPKQFSLVLYHNYGISFSLLNNYPQVSLYISLAAAACLGIMFVSYKTKYLLFFFAGAVGNLLDRIFYGYVIDWLFVGRYINISDISICVGAFLFVWQYAQSIQKEHL